MIQFLSTVAKPYSKWHRKQAEIQSHKVFCIYSNEFYVNRSQKRARNFAVCLRAWQKINMCVVSRLKWQFI